MTDNKIIKALECCIAKDIINDRCDECPNLAMGSYCMDRMLQNTFDLINRQKAEIESNKAKIKISAECIARQDKEIERLNSIRSRWIYDSGTLTKISDELYRKIKAGAFKEFAYRLKENMSDDWSLFSDDGYTLQVDYNKLIDIIDNLVKEMVGEGNV